MRVEPLADPAADLTQCFLKLIDLPGFTLDRLNRHEATLWRQVGQILFTLDALDRRRSHEQRCRFPVVANIRFAGVGISVQRSDQNVYWGRCERRLAY